MRLATVRTFCASLQNLVSVRASCQVALIYPLLLTSAVTELRILVGWQTDLSFFDKSQNS